VAEEDGGGAAAGNTSSVDIGPDKV